MQSVAASFAEASFAPFEKKMRDEGLPDIAIRTFKHYYKQLAAGRTGLIPEQEIAPLEGLPDAEQLPAGLKAEGKTALGQTVIIKLNGGLGTSMGLRQAKSLLPVKNGQTFLDMIACHALHHQVPLVLMNSFNTQADSLAYLEKYPDLNHNLPLDFLQHKVPKINQANLMPAEYPQDPTHEWAPPGHGDIYTALITSGMLTKMLEAGYEYAFVSNADNLGATLDLRILGHFVHHNYPFMMEVADRTEADKKGGHLAVRPDGRFILRESAQVPDEDVSFFQDISRHRFFNTNNIWINLVVLQSILEANQGILGLPMIRNRKPVNPLDTDSTPIYQLETAIGAAIEIFHGASALRVPRTRFAPVKTTSDLLAVQSDAYVFSDEEGIRPNPARSFAPPVIELDPAYYKMLDQINDRFPAGPPSLVNCSHLTITGDITFGRDIRLAGRVWLANDRPEPALLPDNLTIEGNGSPRDVRAFLPQ